MKVFYAFLGYENYLQLNFFFFNSALIIKSSINVMYMTVTALSAERYVTVCHPNFAAKHEPNSKYRALNTIFIMWPLGLLFNLFRIFHYGIWPSKKNPNLIKCKSLDETARYLAGLDSFIFCLIPMLLNCIIFVLIFREVRKTSAEARCCSELIELRSRQRALKILSKNFILHTCTKSEQYHFLV